VVLSPGRQVRLDWIEPPRGQVRILRTNHRLPHQPGSRIDQAQADHLGGEWLITSGPDRAEDSNPPTAGISYYTPMVALGGTYTVGEPAVVSRVVDPTDLRANRLGGPSSNGASTIRVQVQWRWAEGAMTTRLAARLGSPPAGPADPEAILVNVSREEYDRQGAWILNLPKAGLFESSDFEVPAVDPSNPPPPAPPAHWQIRAYSIADLDGAPLASPGLEPTAVTVVPGPNPQVTVSYTLKRSWFPGRPWMLATATDPPGSAVPPLVVVANDRAVPLSADDGTVIAHLPSGTDGTTHAIRTNQPLGRANLRAFVDPTVAPDSLPPVRFRHPETGTTRA
jgi:hypothetical protein